MSRPPRPRPSAPALVEGLFLAAGKRPKEIIKVNVLPGLTFESPISRPEPSLPIGTERALDCR
jgi:hypothetical protein